MAGLAKWSETPGAPFRLMAYAERGRVKIFMYRDKSDWGDTLDGMMTPENPPPLQSGRMIPENIISLGRREAELRSSPSMRSLATR